MPTMPMKPEVKELWLTALRSGEYEQATGTLRGKVKEDKEGYCCLGVLCDIAVKQGAIPEPTVKNQAWGEASYYYGTGEGDSNDSILPPSVAEWAGLFWDDGDGNVKPATTPEIAVAEDDERYGRQPDDDPEYYCNLVELTEMNDTADLGFPVIANYIERYL